VFLNISPEVAAARGGYGLERYESEDVQKGVREVFDKIGRTMQEGGEGKWIEVDAGRSKEEVSDDLWRVVEPLVGGVHEPINRLWETT